MPRILMDAKRNYLGKVTTARYWTKQAKECYYRGCKCFGCSMGTFSFTSPTQKCMMKASVLELVRTIGIPKDKECQRLMVIE